MQRLFDVIFSGVALITLLPIFLALVLLLRLTGKKDFEEFFTDNEILDLDRFQNLGVIKNEANFSPDMLDNFLEVIHDLRSQKVWKKIPIVDLFNKMIPDFDHKETGKYLDGRM